MITVLASATVLETMTRMELPDKVYVQNLFDEASLLIDCC